MTSLRGSARKGDRGGSVTWRDEEQENRVRHIVIREAEIVKVPSAHVVYKINVLTQWNHWTVLRRYSEFFQLHTELVQHYNIARDLLPPKRLTGNFSTKVIEARREALEHYLQRLVNSDFAVATSALLCTFLDVQSHDVMQVAKRLARRAFEEGDAILSNRRSCHYTPTEVFCICKRLKLPMADGDRMDGGSTDLSHLYSFINLLESLVISVPAGHPSSCNMPFSLAHFRSLRSLTIDTCPLALLEGLSSLRAQLSRLSLRHTLGSVKAVIEDAALEKRGQSQSTSSGLSSSGVESWRVGAVVSLTADRPVLQPWTSLTHLDVSRNRITTLDDSLRLLPALQVANFSYNMFQNLDLNRLCIASLRKASFVHNQITSLTPCNREHRPLQELGLGHNRLRSLEGLDAFSQLRTLSVDHNLLASHSDLTPLSEMAQMRALFVTANPFSQKRGYRIGALAMLPHCVSTVAIDNAPITPAERACLDKLSLQHGADSRQWPDNALRRTGSFTSSMSASTHSLAGAQPNSSGGLGHDTNHRHAPATPTTPAGLHPSRPDRQQESPVFHIGSPESPVSRAQASRAASTSPSDGDSLRGSAAASGATSAHSLADPAATSATVSSSDSSPPLSQSCRHDDVPLPAGGHRVIRLDSADAGDEFMKNPFNGQCPLPSEDKYFRTHSWSSPETVGPPVSAFSSSGIDASASAAALPPDRGGTGAAPPGRLGDLSETGDECVPVASSTPTPSHCIDADTVAPGGGSECAQSSCSPLRALVSEGVPDDLAQPDIHINATRSPRGEDVIASSPRQDADTPHEHAESARPDSQCTASSESGSESLGSQSSGGHVSSVADDHQSTPTTRAVVGVLEPSLESMAGSPHCSDGDSSSPQHSSEAVENDASCAVAPSNVVGSLASVAEGDAEASTDSQKP